MVQINFAQKSVTVKIVYYGPGMSGKTTNLEVIHQRAPDKSRGELTSISTDGDRTLFFDFMPLDLGTVAGMRTQFQIYTVPGQVYYNSTRKLVLQGVDGIIFVADSSASMVEENQDSMRNLAENLSDYGKDIAEMPMVIQYNKRDLPDALTVEELDATLNPAGVPTIEGVASSGRGVFPTLKTLASLVLDTVHRSSGEAPSSSPAGSLGTPVPAPGPSTFEPLPQDPLANPSQKSAGDWKSVPSLAAGADCVQELSMDGPGSADSAVPSMTNAGPPVYEPLEPPATLRMASSMQMESSVEPPPYMGIQEQGSTPSSMALKIEPIGRGPVESRSTERSPMMQVSTDQPVSAPASRRVAVMTHPTRIRPRAQVVAIPMSRSNRKTVVLAVACIGAAMAAGMVLGGLLFQTF